MSRMLSTNDCVPAGTLVQLNAGDVPSPGAAPGAAWLNFTGMSPPSGNPETVNVIGGLAGAPPRCPPRSWALTDTVISRMRTERTAARLLRIASLLNED